MSFLRVDASCLGGSGTLVNGFCLQVGSSAETRAAFGSAAEKGYEETMSLGSKRIHYLCILPLLVLHRMPVAAAAASGCDGAGNCYIYASATGTGTGASWTNAYTGFGTAAHQVNPASMSRSVTYWIAAGSYGAVTFSTADTGTSVITIEAPTTTNHGPASDWNNSFAGQALFGESAIASDYWTFNGQTRGSDWRSGYNLKFWNQTDTASNGAIVVNGTNVTIEYVEIEGTNGNYSGSAKDDDGFQFGGNTLYVSHSWIHDAGVDLVVGYSASGSTFEYDMIERNYTGNDSSAHAQAFRVCGPSNMTVRYNMFRDIVNTAVIDTAGPGCTISNWYIYGNVDYWTNGVYTGAGGGQADGLVALFGETSSGVIQIYNNTIAGINAPACNPNTGTVVCNEAALWVCGSACSWGSCSSGNCGSPTVTVYNNLWYNPSSGQDIVIDTSGAQWTATGGYGQNYCPSGGCSNGGGFVSNVNGATNDATGNTGNPFTDFDGSSNFNFGLLANTTAGYSIPNWNTLPSGCTTGTNCFNIDPLGVTRGADGTIDRGVFQIASGAPNPPTNLTAIAH